MDYKKRIIDDQLDLKLESFGATLCSGAWKALYHWKYWRMVSRISMTVAMPWLNSSSALMKLMTGQSIWTRLSDWSGKTMQQKSNARYGCLIWKWLSPGHSTDIVGMTEYSWFRLDVWKTNKNEPLLRLHSKEAPTKVFLHAKSEKKKLPLVKVYTIYEPKFSDGSYGYRQFCARFVSPTTKSVNFQR